MRFVDLPIIRVIDSYFRCKQIEAIHAELQSLARFRATSFYQHGKKLKQEHTSSVRQLVRTHYC
ncbi:MAG: hypothetical protein SD837_21920 [Candidatus Electrothrix scaldis]|nr:MAG: hypothetical protein SD837_21920 [Candidatus Electrothrix sp. GW3-3]